MKFCDRAWKKAMAWKIHKYIINHLSVPGMVAEEKTSNMWTVKQPGKKWLNLISVQWMFCVCVNKLTFFQLFMEYSIFIADAHRTLNDSRYTCWCWYWHYCRRLPISTMNWKKCVCFVYISANRRRIWTINFVLWNMNFARERSERERDVWASISTSGSFLTSFEWLFFLTGFRTQETESCRIVKDLFYQSYGS